MFGALDPARRVLRQLAWAASLGVGVMLAHALFAVWALPSILRFALLAGSEDGQAALALAASALLLAALALLVVWLGGFVFELSPAWGAFAGAFAALFPLGVLAAAEGLGALGPAKVAGARVLELGLTALAGALGARLHRRGR